MNPIAKWIRDYAETAGTKSLVVGISGGVDSALTSTLCAETGLATFAVTMPIHQAADQTELAVLHARWLTEKYQNVTYRSIDLTKAFDCFVSAIPVEFKNALGEANGRARLRMTTLYQVSSAVGGLVVGTGNKVEDFGVGFFTKYGDGGVDISPIGHLLKSEVRSLAKELDVLEEIVNAAPTDGLWTDGRTDEDQLGATYEELEWALGFDGPEKSLSNREREVLRIFRAHHTKNRHKMLPVPTYKK